MEKYILNWDKTAIINTSICLLIIGLLFFLAYRESGWQRWVLLIIALFVLLLPLFSFPRYMTKTADSIQVHFIGHKKELKLSEYKSVEVKADGLSDCTRTCASGGYFGYWGKWRDSSGKKYISYVTDKNKGIYVLMPKDTEKKAVMINAPEEWLKGLKLD